MVSPIDFFALYRDHTNKKKAAAQSGGEPAQA
jgi:hypothetical protein